MIGSSYEAMSEKFINDNLESLKVNFEQLEVEVDKFHNLSKINSFLNKNKGKDFAFGVAKENFAFYGLEIDDSKRIDIHTEGLLSTTKDIIVRIWTKIKEILYRIIGFFKYNGKVIEDRADLLNKRIENAKNITDSCTLSNKIIADNPGLFYIATKYDTLHHLAGDTRLSCDIGICCEKIRDTVSVLHEYIKKYLTSIKNKTVSQSGVSLLEKTLSSKISTFGVDVDGDKGLPYYISSLVEMFEMQRSFKGDDAEGLLMEMNKPVKVEKLLGSSENWTSDKTSEFRLSDLTATILNYRHVKGRYKEYEDVLKELESIKPDENEELTREHVSVVKVLISKYAKAASGYLSTASVGLAVLEKAKF